jgi:N-acetyl-1-D-myo-inositol-2-amino-2-deoxy-alpha-D-glucopyranoside deacetylase
MQTASHRTEPLFNAVLLAVFAHPDDEVFYGGALADWVARGGRAVLATATTGDAGRVHDPALGQIDDLSALRISELTLACERLGIEPPRFLGFRDSGRGDRLRRDDPRALVNAGVLAIERAVLDVVAEIRPHVVLTHDPLGGYDHPDHQAVHHAVTAAFFSAGVLGAAAPLRLFYGTTAHDAFRHFARALRGRGVADTLDPDIFGIAPGMIALSFDARPYARQKRGALAAHRSQFGLTLENLAHPPDGRPAAILDAFTPMLAREDYLLGGTRVPVPRFPLAHFMDGVDASPPR